VKLTSPQSLRFQYVFHLRWYTRASIDARVPGQVYATTTRNKEDAWKFRLESVPNALANESLGESSASPQDGYILVQVKDTGKKEVLTVQPPLDDLVGSLGTVRALIYK